MALPSKPITRQETYLSNIAGQATQLPDAPITREEKYLDYIAKNGGGGGTGEGDMKKSAYDADEAVFNAGGIKAFVNTSISGKVDKVEGKGLSSNDYDDSAKAIVDNVTSALDGKVSKSDTAGLLKNDGTVDTNTYAQTSALSGYIAKSNTAGLVKNDGTIDTTTTGAVAANTSAISAIKDGTDIDSFADVESALSGYIAKSNTAGLVKNDGTIDTTKYASQNALGTVAKLFNSTASYTEGNYVIYNEELYQCETDHTGAWNASHFRKYLAGVANMLNSQYTQASTLAYPFSPDSNYKKGDYVVYFDGYVNLYYKFTQDHSGAWNASHVEQIKIFEELNDLRAAAFPRSEQAVSGQKNFLPNNLTSGTTNGVTATVNADGSTEFDTGGSTASAATSFKFYSAKGSDLQHLNGKIFSGLTNGVSGKYVLRISMRNSPWTTYTTVITEPVTISGIPNTSDVIDIDMFVYSGATLDHVVVYPMISFDGGAYAHYAMTNKELTDAVQEPELSGVDVNTLVEPKRYHLVSNITNLPSGVTTGVLDVIKITSTGVPKKQILYPSGSPTKFYIRDMYSNGTWSAWCEFTGTVIS